jgi:hypothetical protein
VRTDSRSSVAARLANMRQGERTDLSPIGGKSISQDEAADLLNVGKRTVERAKVVYREAETEIIHAVEQGKLSVSHAAKAAKLEPMDSRGGCRGPLSECDADIERIGHGKLGHAPFLLQ